MAPEPDACTMTFGGIGGLIETISRGGQMKVPGLALC